MTFLGQVPFNKLFHHIYRKRLEKFCKKKKYNNSNNNNNVSIKTLLSWLWLKHECLNERKLKLNTNSFTYLN